MRRAATLAGALLLAACGGEDGRAVSLQRMLEQPRADVWEASPVLPGGQVVQPPPEGTVPQEGAADARLDAAAAGGAIPFRVTPGLLRVGGERFSIYCAVCHGPTGYGGSVVAQNMAPNAPPSLHDAARRALPPAAIYAVITRGKGRMPSYAGDLSVRQRWAVVAYVRALQARPPRTPLARADSLAGEVARHPPATGEATRSARGAGPR